MNMVRLTCTVGGIPVPSITWVHNGTVINNGGAAGVFNNGHTVRLYDESYGIITSHLIVNNTNHTGYYYCTATSPVEEYGPVMSGEAHITHKVLGKLYMSMNIILIIKKRILLY